MAGNASRENGKKGGRPKGFAALEAERQRDYVAKRLVKEFAPIVSEAIKQAKEGNPVAREWLANRAYGRPTDHVDHTTNGEAFGSSLADLPNDELEALTRGGAK